MRRPEKYSHLHWDDPIWQVARMVTDIVPRRIPAAHEVHDELERADTPASKGLATYLERHPHLIDPLAEYLAFRMEAAAEVESFFRTEEQAIYELAELGEVEVARYGTKSADHHQSSAVMVKTVTTLTNLTCD